MARIRFPYPPPPSPSSPLTRTVSGLAWPVALLGHNQSNSKVVSVKKAQNVAIHGRHRHRRHRRHRHR